MSSHQTAGTLKPPNETHFPGGHSRKRPRHFAPLSLTGVGGLNGIWLSNETVLLGQNIRERFMKIGKDIYIERESKKADKLWLFTNRAALTLKESGRGLVRKALSGVGVSIRPTPKKNLWW